MGEPRIKDKGEQFAIVDTLGNMYRRTVIVERFLRDKNLIDKDKPSDNVIYHNMQLARHDICLLRKFLVGKEPMKHLWIGKNDKDVCDTVDEYFEEGGFFIR